MNEKIAKNIADFLSILIAVGLALVMSFGIIALSYGQKDPNYVTYLEIKEPNKTIDFCWEQDRPIPGDLFGFELYKSFTSGQYDPNVIHQIISNPNALITTIPPLTEEDIHYFIMKAVEDDGDKSDPSNEVKVKVDYPPKSPKGLGCIPSI